MIGGELTETSRNGSQRPGLSSSHVPHVVIHLCHHNWQYPRPLMFFSLTISKLQPTPPVWPQQRCDIPPIYHLLPSSYLPRDPLDSDSLMRNPVTSLSQLVLWTSRPRLPSSALSNMVFLNAKVSEFRSVSQPNDFHPTELASPTNTTILSSENSIVPIVLGGDRSSPTQHLSSLDSDPDGFLSILANKSFQGVPDRQLQPAKDGLGF